MGVRPKLFFVFLLFLSFSNCFAEAESATSALQCGVNPVLCRGIPVKAGKSFAPTTCSQFHKDCRGEDFTQQQKTMVRSALLVFSISTLVVGFPQNLPQPGEGCGSDRLTGVARQEGDSWSPDGCNNCRCL